MNSRPDEAVRRLITHSPGAPTEAVYRVSRPIPEIGALPGDYLHVEPGHPEFPVVLTRNLDHSMLAFVLDSRISLCSASGAPAEPPAPPPAGNARPSGTPLRLRLVR